MKSYVATTTILALLLFSCQKEVHNTATATKKELNHDTFGFSEFSPTYRTYNARKYPRKPIKDTVAPRDTTSGDTTTSQPPYTPDIVSYQSVILLDADGYNVSGTSWNVRGDFFASPANISYAELIKIVDSVAFDYAPFKITVTTDESLYNIADPYKRMRVLITDSYQWYGSGAGGVSYTGSFTWGDNTPCFVFASLLGYNNKHIREAASHEAGHTIGLRHQAEWKDGILVSSYNSKPVLPGGHTYIMGLPYYYVSDFGIGLDPYGRVQDDKQIIASVVGYK